MDTSSEDEEIIFNINDLDSEETNESSKIDLSINKIERSPWESEIDEDNSNESHNSSIEIKNSEKKPWETDNESENLDKPTNNPWEEDSNNSLNSIKMINQDEENNKKPWETDYESSFNDKNWEIASNNSYLDIKSSNEKKPWEIESDDENNKEFFDSEKVSLNKSISTSSEKKLESHSQIFSEDLDLNQNDFTEITDTNSSYESISKNQTFQSPKSKNSEDNSLKSTYLFPENNLQESFASEQIFGIDDLQSLQSENKILENSEDTYIIGKNSEDTTKNNTIPIDNPIISEDFSKESSELNKSDWENLDFESDLQDILDNENFESKIEKSSSNKNIEFVSSKQSKDNVEFEYQILGKERVQEIIFQPSNLKNKLLTLDKKQLNSNHPYIRNAEYEGPTVSRMLSRSHQESELILNNEVLLSLVLNLYIHQQFDMESQIKELKAKRKLSNMNEFIDAEPEDIWKRDLQYENPGFQNESKNRKSKSVDKKLPSIQFLEKQFPQLKQTNKSDSLESEYEENSNIIEVDKIESNLFSERKSLFNTLNQYITKYLSPVDSVEQYLFKQSMNLYPEFSGLTVEQVKALIIVEMIEIISKIIEDLSYSQSLEKIRISFNGPIFVKKYANELVVYLPFHPHNDSEFSLEYWVQDFHLFEIIGILSTHLRKSLWRTGNMKLDVCLFNIEGISKNTVKKKNNIQVLNIDKEVKKHDIFQSITQQRQNSLLKSLELEFKLLQNGSISKGLENRIEKELEIVLDKLLSDNQMVELIVNQVKNRIFKSENNL